MEDARNAGLVVKEVRTRDVEEYQARLGEVYGPIHSFSVDGESRDFQSSHTIVSLGDVSISRSAGTPHSIGFELADNFMVKVPVAGSVVAVSGDDKVSLSRETAASIPPGIPVTMHHGASSVCLALVMPLAMVKDQATAMLGGSPAVCEGIELLHAISLASGAGAALSRNLAAAYSEMVSLANAGLRMVATRGLADYLVSLAALAAIPAARDIMSSQPAYTGRQAFERAAEYLRTHAGESVSMAELARDLGVSLRSLQLEFQRRLGRSPLEFLFERRLELARSRLLAAEPGLKVTDVAIQSGFANLGAFAARYREAFGELPSETLARALRR